jgi:hypothetical protein
MARGKGDHNGVRAKRRNEWYWLRAGSGADNLGQVNCRFKASSAYVGFHG